MKRWKSTLREGISAVVGFLPVFVLIGNELEWDKTPEMAGVFAIASALATGLAAPAGKAWIKRHLGPPDDDHPPPTP